MTGTVEGARRRAASHLGLDIQEYMSRIASGLKWCTDCKAWEPVSIFGVDRSRGDGLKVRCRAAALRRALIPPDRQKPRGPRGGRHTAETRQRMSDARRGKPGHRLGKRHSAETRARISATVRAKAVRGPAHPAYKDGKVSERRGERFSTEAKRWRVDVFQRDGYRCCRCGDDRGGNLVAHHIEGWASHPSLRYVLENGETLCQPCHVAHHREHGYG